MIVRVGIPASFRRFTAVAAEINAPILISANALTRRNLDYYRPPTHAMLNGRPAALDSAGFVATKIYGGYIQPRAAYVALAGSYAWDWWAQRDFCCEPEIARDRTIVLERVEYTVLELAECRREAEDQGVTMPMPVLQGWLPDDYKLCADKMGDLPALIGVGGMVSSTSLTRSTFTCRLTSSFISLGSRGRLSPPSAAITASHRWTVSPGITPPGGKRPAPAPSSIAAITFAAGTWNRRALSRALAGAGKPTFAIEAPRG